MIKVLIKVANILFKLSCKIRSLSDKADELAHYRKIKKEKGLTKKEWQRERLERQEAIRINADKLFEVFEKMGANTADLIKYRIGIIKGTLDKWEQDIKNIDKAFKVNFIFGHCIPHYQFKREVKEFIDGIDTRDNNNISNTYNSSSNMLDTNN